MRSSTAEKIKHVCRECGSSDVRAEAECEWNIEKQAWEIIDFYDRDYCMDCADDTNLEEAPLDVKDLAKLAIKGATNE